MNAVNLAIELGSITESAKFYGISINNIKRWIMDGVENKPRLGKLVRDKKMERELLEWVEDFE